MLVEAELLEQAAEREQQLLKLIETICKEVVEWKQFMMQCLANFQPIYQVRCSSLLRGCFHFNRIEVLSPCVRSTS
jgi:hypothetical protein